ncbi:MAG: mechanosensitive ion channel family protein, partial [bacterium]
MKALDHVHRQIQLLGRFMYEIKRPAVTANLLLVAVAHDAVAEQNRADALRVKYVFLFDKNGKVVVTNAPYDHLQVGNDPEDFTFQFRRVMEGVEHIVLKPLQDEWLGEYIQYVAESRRDADNKCDGFVLIGVDPALRDRLLEALKVDTVLDNMIIGLPEYAIAVDRQTLKIVAATDKIYEGVSIGELGITEEMLMNDFSGFLNIGGTEYYAGVSMSSEYYLVPIVRRTGNLAAVMLSLKIALVALASALVIILLTLFRYQKNVIDAWPKEAEPSQSAPEAETAPETGTPGRFMGLSNLLRTQDKKGFEDRWHMNDIPAAQRTPEQRIGRILYRLMLVFCLVILLPTLYANLQGGVDPSSLNNLAYVISGNWQKGVNIFAFTACVFLLCAMYVVVVLLNQILYRIAKVSDMRVETVCLLLKNAVKYICMIVFVYYGLAQFGVQTQTLLASAGIMSLMVSFGAKDLVSDIIAGFFTIFEGTYKVGDFITVGNWHGTVTEIGLRTTKVRFFAETKIFSNSSVRDIINADGEVARMVLKAPISYDADLLQIEAILDEELPKMMDTIPGLVKPPQYEGLDSLGESS